VLIDLRLVLDVRVRLCPTLAHRIALHLNAMRVVDKAVEDAAGQRGIADLPVSSPSHETAIECECRARRTGDGQLTAGVAAYNKQLTSTRRMNTIQVFALPEDVAGRTPLLPAPVTKGER
jgi:hypothetical protein